jgi:uncharacterized repeat protein (TIGR01451 family)
MKILLLTILAFISLQLNAQTWVQVPDANFQSYLTAHYPAAAFMTSGGNFFVDSDHAAIQAEDSLEISSLNIASIEGVQAFDNLVFLKCRYNQIVMLPVNLPVNLQTLYCRGNLLTELPDLPLNLVFLECGDNQIMSLPVLPGTLFYLECSSNGLVTLPNLPGSLHNLACSGNELTFLPELPPYLNFLNCSVNQLDSLPDLPDYLQMLGCSSNHLLTLPNLPNSLQTMDCQENQLTELPVLPGALQTLICDSNQITVLPDLPNSLTFFSCIKNSIAEIGELPQALESFYCYRNDILCFAEFPVLIQNMNIDDNPFTCLPNYIPAMGTYYLGFPLCDANNPNGCSGATGIEGMVFHDINNDCIPAGGILKYVPMSVYDSIGNLIVSSTSLANGNYYFSAGPGSYQLEIDTLNLTPSLEVTCPVGNTSSAFIPYTDTVVSGGDFGLNCAGFDLGVQSIVPNGWIFPGQTHELSVLAGDATAQYNMHCATGIAGEVTIAVTGPGVITFGGSPTNVSANTAVYSIADFGAVNVNEFAATILTNTNATAGDEFCVTVSVATNASGELDIANNLYSYCYGVVNSLDPNEKETYPEIVQPGYVDEFTYTIHFQNTGSAPAFNIRLADTLDINLDLTTLKVVNASDAFTTTLNPNTRLLTVRFPNIMLPASSVDPEGSIGFIQYRVKPVAGLLDGTVIENRAYIYFDFNSPIVTNTSENLFSVTAGLGELVDEKIQLYPNPSDSQVFIRSENSVIEQVMLYDLNGMLVKTMSPNSKQTSVDTSNLKAGIYITTIQTNQSVVTKRLIVR